MEFGGLTRRQVEIYIVHKQGKSQAAIAEALGIRQPVVSRTLTRVGQAIREAQATLECINILEDMEIGNMEFTSALELLRKRHEEKKLRSLNIQGNIRPVKVKGNNAVFTVGYEKREIKNFIRLLKVNNVRILVDIRANGFSHKVDFSNKTLERNLALEDIDYLAMRELGSPKELRNGLKKRGYSWFFNEYEKYIDNEKNELDKLEKIVKYTRSCLMCFELDPNQCHRSIVSNKLTDRGFEIVHL